MSRNTANTVVLLASVLFSLLLLEIGLRVYAGLIYPKMMVLDEKLGWRHAANVSRTFRNELGEEVLVVQNAYGHRGKRHDGHATEGVFRILALGDSFTEGVQVGERELFTTQLEITHSGLETINAGVGGYGTVQEYLYLATEGLQFHPNLVLLMFYENDLTDNALSYYPALGPRPYATLTEGHFRIVETLDASEYQKFILPVPLQMLLNNHSYFYYFVNSRIYQRMFAERINQLEQADLRKISSETRYELFYKLLERIRGLLKQQRIPLLLVLIPTADEVARGNAGPAAVIDAYCRAQNISCLFLIERFRREASSGRQLYFPIDIHWTKEGHRVAADEIFKYLRFNTEEHLGWSKGS